MAIVQIPTSQSLPFYSQKTLLDGQTYTLQFKWNDREEAWYLDLLTDLEEPISMGIKIVTDWPLNRRITDPAAPPGVISAIDTTGAGTNPGFEDLGNKIILVYIDEDELE